METMSLANQRQVIINYILWLMISSSNFFFEKLAWLQVYVELRKFAFKNNIFGLRKFSVSKIFYPWILIWKMDVRTNFRIITKNSAAEPEKGLNVLVRAFLKEQKGGANGTRTHAIQFLDYSRAY